MLTQASTRDARGACLCGGIPASRADPGEEHDLSDGQVDGLEPLLQAQQEWLAEMTASGRPGREIELTPEEIRRLESLGYLVD